METAPADAAPAASDIPDRLRTRVREALEGRLAERELYTELHRAVAAVMDTDGFYIALYDPGADLAEVVYWAEGAEEGEQSRVTYPGSRSEVLRTGRPTLVEDRLESRSLRILGEGDGPTTRSAVSAPLTTAQGLLGAVSAQSFRAGAYTARDMEVLEALAGLAATSLGSLRRAARISPAPESGTFENALEELVRSATVEDVLRATVDAATGLVAGSGAVFWLLDGSTAWAAAVWGPSAPEQDFSVPLVGEGARILIEERRDLRVADFGDSELFPPRLRSAVDARNVVAVPVVWDDEVSGVISVGTGADRPFTEEESRRLRRLADAAAGALARARQLSHMESLSLTDSLTGLPNRRHVEMHLAREFSAAERGRDLSVILFDVDSFRQYNATLGRMAGDEVLRTLAEVLSGETRAMNLVGRYEGDAFLAILSDTPADGARLHAERVEERVARHSGLGPHGITVSFGVATYTEEMTSPVDLIRAADHDLERRAPGHPDDR